MSRRQRHATRRALPWRSAFLSGHAVKGRYTQQPEISVSESAPPPGRLYSTRDEPTTLNRQHNSGPPETLSALRRHRMDTGTNRGPEHDAWVRPAPFLRKSPWSLHECVWGRAVWPCESLLAAEHEDETAICSGIISSVRKQKVLANRSLTSKASHNSDPWLEILDVGSLAAERFPIASAITISDATRDNLRDSLGVHGSVLFPPGFTLSLARASVPLLPLTYRCKTESAEPGPVLACPVLSCAEPC